ncbi:hypothetical protein [Streptosporangium lutulentum]|uniref:Uncharacterized protein n=1 Tax=Streptosporangium lutulentum TaxID=1461250 RepID=A0ABT9Q680_9ACTN|nr:hypothetical protein [Streptosporangium lutulentum]MDP9842252.1 hypothetical protein [Streptosporangium lutulentum]
MVDFTNSGSNSLVAGAEDDPAPVSEDERKREAWLERHAAIAPRLSPDEWAAANACLGIRVSGSREPALPRRQAA